MTEQIKFEAKKVTAKQKEVLLAKTSNRRGRRSKYQDALDEAMKMKKDECMQFVIDDNLTSGFRSIVKSKHADDLDFQSTQDEEGNRIVLLTKLK